MKIKYLIFFILPFFFLVFSCKEDTGRALVPVKFVSPQNNSMIPKGEKVKVGIEISDLKGIETLKVFWKDSILFEGVPSSEQLTFELNTSSWNFGSVQISLEAKMKDEKMVRSYRQLRVLPLEAPKDYSAEVVTVYPHETTSYTQGLEFDGDQLYEGTGGYANMGGSTLAKVDLETGKIIKRHNLNTKYFGEGITIFKDKIFQLTWQEHICFVYDKNTLEVLDSITYTGEGWGLCNDGKQLIMSDGSERLYFRDPKTFGITKTLEVYSNLGPLKGLNELEYIQGKIYANVYTSNTIVIIDAETGVVTGKIDASLIALDYRKTGEVLNGIAYKESTKQLFITGKNWPNVLEIALVEE